MIEKKNTFCISCLNLQEYKKNKNYHFESRGELNCDFKNFKKFQKNFKIFFTTYWEKTGISREKSSFPGFPVFPKVQKVREIVNPSFYIFWNI